MSDFGPSIFHCLVQNEEDPKARPARPWALLFTPGVTKPILGSSVTIVKGQGPGDIQNVGARTGHFVATVDSGDLAGDYITAFSRFWQIATGAPPPSPPDPNDDDIIVPNDDEQAVVDPPAKVKFDDAKTAVKTLGDLLNESRKRKLLEKRERVTTRDITVLREAAKRTLLNLIED